ncbi:MAG TPA: aminopeptidase P N-terminal domain-containing protein [Candidatus Saccharimonadales bacterium]|nr:aminopeptidase P N-terminal domain-containing protein [Candidatus Saccharimonadales bacterium]
MKLRTLPSIRLLCWISLFCVFFITTSLFALDRQAGADYRARRVALSQKLNGGVAVLFAATEAEGPNAVYGFRQDNNFFYLTGWAEPGAAVVIAPAMEAKGDIPARSYAEVLFLPAHNLTQEKWTGPKLSAEDSQAREVTGFDRVATLDQMHDVLTQTIPQPRAVIFTAIAQAPETTPSTTPLEWLKRTNSLPNFVRYEQIDDVIAGLRKHKDTGEIERIRHATEASMTAHRAAFKAMRPGLFEYQIAALMQYKFQDRGCERPAYAPIVGSGFYSTVLHYSEDSHEIYDGDVVVMDVAGEYGMYASDITRTVPANGHFTARQREIYNVVLGAQQAVMQAVVAGKSVLNKGEANANANSLYQVAYDYINTHGKDVHGQPLGKYFIHGLGHRVGLEVHDVGTGPVDKGDVFTVEPGIYIPEEKIGVRIEDIVMLDEAGKLVNLTAALPHTAEEVEAAMQK